MSVFAISDLHLALSIDKPMDVFGERWAGYMDKIKSRWIEAVSENDYVIMPGDISWATYLEQAVEDFKFIDSLPGKKVISKGNHDYWWTTHSKLEQFLENNKFSSISFMQNNSFRLEGMVICGTRGWKCPGDDEFTAEDRKIFNRELQRLELSLKSAELREGERIIAALHYPPFNQKKQPTEFVEIMKSFGVDTCVYGHLHGAGFKNAFLGEYNYINFRLISADFLEFEPVNLQTIK